MSRKRFTLLTLLALLLSAPVFMAATQPDIIPRIQDNDKGTRVSLWIPGFLVRLGGRLAGEEMDPEVQRIVRKTGSIRVEVSEAGLGRAVAG